MAERMAREMFPHKFSAKSGSCIEGEPLADAGRPHERTVFMISPEEFDRRNEEAQRATVFPPPRDYINDPIREGELREIPGGFALDRTHAPIPPTDQSPLTRLFAAVRGVLAVVESHDCDDRGNIACCDEINELSAAYKALGLTDE